jgi:ATP-dependent Lhr-like helicase
MIDKTDKNLKQQLKYSWVPFFARFGRLTPIQRLTIPKVLEGKNVIVSSPTATGKTEAIIAPVSEIAKREKWTGLSIIYIVPTRALANDSYGRIEGPLGDMGFKVILKHGDRPHLSSTTPANLLITTPESLDSLICRHPQMLKDLRAIIIDEIHFLDSNYRGDQLRVLLLRLRNLQPADRHIFVHLLSATISNPNDIASRYIDDFDIVIWREKPQIEYYFVSSYEELNQLSRRKYWRKILCFCNMREKVEEIASQLSQIWYPYPVLAHHGSLSKEKREEAEAVMRESDVAVCVATSTLELGIDIGDIDCVVLLEPPWSIASLLQRIGRGNRRTGLIQVVAYICSKEERELLEMMFNAAMEGVLPILPYSPDLSVVVQQIFSLLYQFPEGLPENDLLDTLSPLCTYDELNLVLQQLQKERWVEMRGGVYCASTKLMDKGEKGRIHSNIPEAALYRVIDVRSGKQIGRIADIFDKVFLLAGSIWEVVSVEDHIVYVKRVKGKAFSPLFYRYSLLGAFFHLLPPVLKEEQLENLRRKMESL